MPSDMPATVEPLLGERELDQLRTALEGFTVDGVAELLGPPGRAAHSRGDLAGVARALRGASDARLEVLARLFLLGGEVEADEAASALHPLSLPAAAARGLLERSGDSVRARVDIRPYAEAGAEQDGPWWVVSDLGADVRPGPLPRDHVLGIGSASLTLAQAVSREPVGRALDVGTGSGVQSLHLGLHAGSVCATDVSARALRFAATTAALSGQRWDLRRGSLLEPVAGERFDLVVANPPFVVSSGRGTVAGYDYRDSGLPGDELCARLVRTLPDVLTDAGHAVLLANWVLPPDGDWAGRLAAWLQGAPVDAWVWQREVADPGEYVTLWLRDAGEVPGTPRFAARYDEWLDWFAAADVAAIGMGMVFLWRTDAAEPIREFDDIPQQVEQPLGGVPAQWLRRQRWLRRTSDAELFGTRLRLAPEVVRRTDDVLTDTGWAPMHATLRQSGGLRWQVTVDEVIATLVSGSAHAPTMELALELLAASLDLEPAELAAAAAPVVRDLIGRGFLLPVPPGADGDLDADVDSGGSVP